MIKLLCHTHTYPPNHASGADIYMERINTWLGDYCQIKVIIDVCTEPYTYKNHRVESNQHRIAESYEWCDIVITNLVTNNQAIHLSNRFKKPIFHIVHNDEMPYIEPSEYAYVVYNSYWLQKARPLPFKSIVVQPPTWTKDWKRSKHGECVTLINLTYKKGGQVLHNLSMNMPRIQFLAVKGGYGQQYMQPMPNIDMQPFTKDMQSIYDRTRILIVPSLRESWSLCAAEAQACGIPVICNDLPGLRENLGDSAMYAINTRAYMDAIRSDLSWYIEAGLQRAQEREKNHILQLENLYSFMSAAVNKNRVTVIKQEHRALPGNPSGFVTLDKEKTLQDIERKEKVMFKPTKEKKIIKKPITPH